MFSRVLLVSRSFSRAMSTVLAAPLLSAGTGRGAVERVNELVLWEEQRKSICQRFKFCKSGPWTVKHTREIGANSFNCPLDFAHSYLKYLLAEEKLFSGEALTSLNVLAVSRWPVRLRHSDGEKVSIFFEVTQCKEDFIFSFPFV